MAGVPVPGLLEGLRFNGLGSIKSELVSPDHYLAYFLETHWRLGVRLVLPS